MKLLKLSAHMVQSTRALTAPSATFLTTTVKMSTGNLMGKAAPAVKINTVKNILGAQSAKMYSMTFFDHDGSSSDINTDQGSHSEKRGPLEHKM